MNGITALPLDWKDELALLFRSAAGDLLVVTPYFTSFGTQLLADNLSPEFSCHGTIRFLTDLSPLNICAGATQPAALVSLQTKVHQLRVTHLPNLHAKIYVADHKRAIVTSGNLTGGVLLHNHEYGLLIQAENIITIIHQDVAAIAALGTDVTGDSLQSYARIAEDLLKKYARKLRSARTEVAREFENALHKAEDELVAFRLAGGPITTVFEKTVMYLLGRYGALPTQRLHPMIKAIHPDLCDDSVDRVINGQHFGKKWKHAVRRAQSHLKDRGAIERIDGLWQIRPSES